MVRNVTVATDTISYIAYYKFKINNQKRNNGYETSDYRNFRQPD